MCLASRRATARRGDPGRLCGTLRLQDDRSAWPSRIVSGIAGDFQQTFVTLRNLPCDIPLGAHGIYFDLLAKADRMAKQGPGVWIDPEGYRETVADAEASFKKMLAEQRASAR